MKISRLSWLAFLLLGVMSLANSTAFACSCRSLSVCEAYNRSQAIFIGRVIKASKQAERNYGDKPFVEYFGEVLMEVIEPFSGVSERTITVWASGGGMCFDYSFSLNRTYLVYASESKDKKLIVSGCSRTRWLTPITYDPSDSESYRQYILGKQKEYAEELEFLRNVANGKVSGARIYGNVSATGDYLKKGKRSYLGPVSDVKIEIKSDGNFTTIQANSEGLFSIQDLKPGAYSVTVILPDGYAVEDEERLKKEVLLRNCGCAELSFHLVPDTAITGKVIDEDGKPVEGVKVNLISADWQEETEDSGILSYKTRDCVSGKDGQYVFENVAAGRYLIGVSVINPNPRFPFQKTFYPNTSDIKKAKPVEVVLGRKAGLFELRLGKKVETHSIQGVVLWPDETPVVGASVRLSFEGDYKSQDEADTDEQGRFTLKAVTGRDYEINVYWHDDEGASGKIKPSPLGWENATSERERITVNKDIKDLKFVLTKRQR